MADAAAHSRTISLALAVVTILAFAPILRNGFVLVDDPACVTHNAWVQQGLTPAGVARAFTTVENANWHPLTWLSHMLDCSLYGLSPTGHHLTSLLLHAANALLLFAILRAATGAVLPSAAAAALFALHPLRVESVAWIAERKDVLSAFFAFLALRAYVAHARSPSRGKYAATLVFFALGLMAKPMVVVLPLIMILMDWWPLQRPRPFGMRSLGEKLPFAVMAGAVCAVTLYAQAAGGAVQSAESFPPAVRIANALVSCCRYVGKTIYPVHLAAFYPHPGHAIEIWQGAVAGLLLCAASAGAIAQRRKRPWFFTGWFWFLGSLLPVIGLVQVGSQAMADRYTYVPGIGLVIIAVWAARDLAARYRIPPAALWAAILALLAGLASLTWVQTGYWRDTGTLYTHDLRVTRDNYAAHMILYGVESAGGDMAAAQAHYNEALRINPAYVAMTHNQTGYGLLAEAGDVDGAVGEFRKAIALLPGYANAHNNLGVALARRGEFAEAIAHFTRALELSPDYTEARRNLQEARRLQALQR